MIPRGGWQAKLTSAEFQLCIRYRDHSEWERKLIKSKLLISHLVVVVGGGGGGSVSVLGGADSGVVRLSQVVGP